MYRIIRNTTQWFKFIRIKLYNWILLLWKFVSRKYLRFLLLETWKKKKTWNKGKELHFFLVLWFCFRQYLWSYQVVAFLISLQKCWRKIKNSSNAPLVEFLEKMFRIICIIISKMIWCRRTSEPKCKFDIHPIIKKDWKFLASLIWIAISQYYHYFTVNFPFISFTDGLLLLVTEDGIYNEDRSGSDSRSSRYLTYAVSS